MLKCFRNLLALLALLFAAAGGIQADTITLKTSPKGTPGEILEGKVREWGHKVIFWDKYGDKTIYRRTDIAKVEYKRPAKDYVKPQLPDLTVAFIARLPRDPGFHGVVKYDLPGKKDCGVLTVDPNKYQLHRKVGEEVTFLVHILNAGSVPTTSFDYRVLIDDKEIKSGAISEPIRPLKEVTTEAKWKWQDGQHYIKVELDTEGKIKEITEENNTFVDPIRALTFFFAVHKTTYENFSKCLNVVDSFCFEDWAQYHVHTMNYLFKNSVWPSTPNGIEERVRVDNIVAVEDTKPEFYEKLRRINGDPNELIEYNGNWVFGKSAPVEKTQKWALGVDWGLPHELGHQLGLVDIYQLNADPFQNLVKRSDGAYCNLKHFFPWPATMMHWHGPHLFSEQGANYLNLTRGRPRGYFGDYYYALPEKNYLKVYSGGGVPVKGAKVGLYQRNASGEFRSFIGPEPVASVETDENGLFLMPNRPAPSHRTFGTELYQGFELKPNPWGHINVVGANGLMLAKITYKGYEEFYWLRLFDFNVAYFRGEKDKFIFKIKSHFPDEGAPKPPTKLRARFRENDRLDLLWERSASPDIALYKVYKKVGDGGMETKPFRLVKIVDPVRNQRPKQPMVQHGLTYFDEFQYNGFYTKDTWFAVTAAAKDGRESGFSNVVYVPDVREGQKAAVAPDGRVFFTARRNNMLFCYSEDGGLTDFGVRAKYRAALGGIAFARAAGAEAGGEGWGIIATDYWNHQLLFFKSDGALIKRVGAEKTRHEEKSTKEGELNRPEDLAVDDDGNIYVADTENHRVQVFDHDGKFLYAFGKQGEGELEFRRPSAINWSAGKLLVTDTGNRRVMVYDVSAGKSEKRPKCVLTIAKLRHPDRALIAPSGTIYVCDTGDNAIKVFNEKGRPVRAIRRIGRDEVLSPRGLCADGKGNAYFVTTFPIKVLKLALE